MSDSDEATGRFSTMPRHFGRLVHKSVSDEGVAEVVDDGNIRSLYLGSGARQSSMRTQEPCALELTYTQSMMCSLLFRDRPLAVLLVGLGGGSLAKFLFEHYPDCRIDAVESRADVVGLAYDYFQLPQDERLCVHIGDGAQFLAEAQRRYDLILVDAFDCAGVAASVAKGDFFRNSYQRLAPGGVFVMNLWGSKRAEFNAALAEIGANFTAVLKLPVRGGGNVVVFGFARPLPPRWERHVRERALCLRQRLDVDFPKLTRALQQHKVSCLAGLITRAGARGLDR